MSGTVAAAFGAAAARWSTRPFLHILDETALAYAIAPGAQSYGDVAAAVAALSARYAAAGWGCGHRVGLMLENRPAVFVHWLALNAPGVGVVPLSAELRAPELRYVSEHSGMAFAVAAAVHRARLRDALTCPVAEEADTIPEAPCAAHGTTDGTTECALLYTSGTTGRPKGCVLSNDYFLRCGTWYANLDGLCTLRAGEERLITPLPMVHVNAMAFSTLAMVLTGGCIIPLDRFHPRSWWASVREADATILHSLGVMPTMLLGLPPSPLDRAHRVRFGFAPAVDPSLHAAFEARFGLPMIDAWSMTETGAGAVVIANREPRHVGRSCFGRPEPAVAVRIVDETGADVADDMPGEMLVRAAGADARAGFFTAYLKDPAAAEAAWAGGWFHTGDVVRRDLDGFLFFVDRRKNVIRRSGENIAAVEVESVVRRHPMVRDVACAPVPDPLRGEEVFACIVPHAAPSGCGAAAVAIVSAALEELAYFKAPGWIAFVAALPLTATNKVQRGELRALAVSLAGTEGCIDTRALKTRRA